MILFSYIYYDKYELGFLFLFMIFLFLDYVFIKNILCKRKFLKESCVF